VISRSCHIGSNYNIKVILDILGPDLQNVLRQSYDYLTIMPNLRSTYDGRRIYKTKAFPGCDSLAES